jgi:hypothetical protein
VTASIRTADSASQRRPPEEVERAWDASVFSVFFAFWEALGVLEVLVVLERMRFGQAIKKSIKSRRVIQTFFRIIFFLPEFIEALRATPLGRGRHAGLPGNVISLYPAQGGMPLFPTNPAFGGTGHFPVTNEDKRFLTDSISIFNLKY